MLSSIFDPTRFCGYTWRAHGATVRSDDRAAHALARATDAKKQILKKNFG